MVLQSVLPHDPASASRLREYEELVRHLSQASDPQALINSFREKGGFVMPVDHRLSLSRVGLDRPRVRITRSLRWRDNIDPWKEQGRLPVLDRGLLSDLMYAARPVKIDDLELDAHDPAYEHIGEMRSLLAAPLYDLGEPTHMVVLLREEPGAFTIQELCDAMLTGNLVGRATSNLLLARQISEAHAALDREFRAVGEIQRGLLPRSAPKIRSVTFATHYEPSTRAGGDYYDFFRFSAGKWGVIIADVSGHGPSAAVVMAMMRTLLQARSFLVCDHPPSPAEVLAYLNRGLYDSINAGQFATAFVAIFDPDAREIQYASAGHNPPRWLHGARQEIVALDGEPGLPLAILAEHDAPVHRIRYESGDRILLYTDGITETFNEQQEMFGAAGLDAALRCCSATAAGLIQAIDHAVRRHANDAPAEDDRTLVALAFH